jgi:type I restriction enzyme S subunit
MKIGYKQTEVGVIPEEWEEKSIRSVCKLINGRGFKPHEWKSNGLPIIRIQNLNGSEDFNYFEGPYAKKLEVENGQLLFAWSGSRGTSFGPHVWNGSLGLLNYHTWKVQVDGRSICTDFFLHALKQLTKFIEDRAHGASALVHTQKWEMEGFTFPMPPTTAEQRAIASALSDVDGLLGALDRLIAKKRDLKQAAMQQLLTGQTRLPGFHGEWEVKRLGDVASVSKGTQLHSSETDEGGKFAHLNGGITPSSYTHKSNTNGNTIAISEGGNSCGFVQFMTAPYWCGGHCYSVIPNGVDNHFLYHALKGQQSAIMGLRVGSGLPNVQKTGLLDFKIELPATHPEQTAIAEVLTEMDAELAALEQRREKTRALKQGMMQELLTGRTRLT